MRDEKLSDTPISPPTSLFSQFFIRLAYYSLLISWLVVVVGKCGGGSGSGVAVTKRLLLKPEEVGVRVV